MRQVPIEQQRLHPDEIQFLKHERSLGNEITGGAILRAVEQFAGKAAPTELRELLLEASISPPRAQLRGRRPNHSGIEDFVLEQVNRIYPWLLRRYRQDKTRAARTHAMPPSERAYRFLAERARKHLKNVDWTTLRNKHTDWKRGRFHKTETCTDSEEYEASIEAQFPAPDSSQ